jgi:lipoate-protein ligase A
VIWHFIDSGLDTGANNMSIDLELAEKAKSNEAFFRLYRWKPYCISLGANQSFDDINIEKTKAEGIDVVKRPTGGRAILHAEEITYSVALPLSIGLSPKEIYTKISNALVKGLILYSPQIARHIALEEKQPHFPSLLKQDSGALCFASSAKSEVKFDAKKIIGSAQRKMQNVILQHGSILVGTFHRKLPEYLNVGTNLIEKLKIELAEKTIELETILQTKVDYQKLSE